MSSMFFFSLRALFPLARGGLLEFAIFRRNQKANSWNSFCRLEVESVKWQSVSQVGRQAILMPVRAVSSPADSSIGRCNNPALPSAYHVPAFSPSTSLHHSIHFIVSAIMQSISVIIITPPLSLLLSLSLRFAFQYQHLYSLQTIRN